MDASPVPDEIDGVPGHEHQGWVKAELEPGERLLWSAPPVLKPFRVGGGVVAAAIVACGSFMVWILLLVTSFRTQLPDRGFALGLILFLIGLFFCVGILNHLTRLRNLRARLAGTLYALTDRRAIIWSPESSSGAVKVVTVPRGRVAGVHRVQYPDGSGDIVFRNMCAGFQFGDEYFAPTEAGFFGVAEVRRVEEQVRRTLVVNAAETGVAGRREPGDVD